MVTDEILLALPKRNVKLSTGIAATAPADFGDYSLMRICGCRPAHGLDNQSRPMKFASPAPDYRQMMMKTTSLPDAVIKYEGIGVVVTEAMMSVVVAVRQRVVTV